MSTKIDRNKIVGSRQLRDMSIESRGVDVDARTVSLAFSSEIPIDRYWGKEILDHNPESVRLDRLRDGGAFLLQHDPDKHLGVIESALISITDRIGRAVIRFGNSDLANEILRDIADGIRLKISCSYIIHEMVLEGTSDGLDTYRITDWEPLEISSVSIPADYIYAGIGRSIPQEISTMKNEIIEPAEDSGPNDEPHVESTRPEARSVHEDSPTIPSADEMEIMRIGDHFGLRDLAHDHIVLGTPLDEFRGIIRQHAAARIQPVPIAPRLEMTIPRRTRRLRAYRPELYSNLREADEAAFRAGQWAKAAIGQDPDAMRWCKDHGVRVMTGTSGSTSALVPDEMILPLIDLRESYGVARQLCDVVPMSSDTAPVPRRTGGVTAYFADRETATTESDATFDNVNLVARELSALTRLSNQYLADSVIDLADHLTSEMAYAFAVKEDQCLVDGDGTSTYGGIYGIRPKIIDGNHTAGAIDAASGHDTWLEIDVSDLAGVEGALPEFPGIMPVWLVSKRANALMFGRLKNAAGGNTKRDLAAGESPQWDGDDIVISQAMPKGTGTTDYSNVVMAVYGDLRMGVSMGDRQIFEVQILRERYAEYRQTGVIGVERFDLVVHGLGDTSDAGPIVALVGE